MNEYQSIQFSEQRANNMEFINLNNKQFKEDNQKCNNYNGTNYKQHENN